MKRKNLEPKEKKEVKIGNEYEQIGKVVLWLIQSQSVTINDIRKVVQIIKGQ